MENTIPENCIKSVSLYQYLCVFCFTRLEVCQLTLCLYSVHTSMLYIYTIPIYTNSIHILFFVISSSFASNFLSFIYNECSLPNRRLVTNIHILNKKTFIQCIVNNIGYVCVYMSTKLDRCTHVCLVFSYVYFCFGMLTIRSLSVTGEHKRPAALVCVCVCFVHMVCSMLYVF